MKSDVLIFCAGFKIICSFSSADTTMYGEKIKRITGLTQTHNNHVINSLCGEGYLIKGSLPKGIIKPLRLTDKGKRMWKLLNELRCLL